MAQTTALSRAFHGQASYGEGSYPGSGGNLNSVYDGAGQDQHVMPEDVGYPVGQFPVGGLPSGTERQEFRISDSNAFNNLRGIAKTSFPFDPYPANDHVNKQASSLHDEFQQSDMAGVSSLMPGKFSYNLKQGMLGKQIIDEFNAGTSTFNSLPWGESAYGIENQDKFRRGMPSGQSVHYNAQVQEGIAPQSIEALYKESFVSPNMTDVPLTPFHKTYPNFGTGHVDYGFQDPGSDEMSADIIRSYHAILPEGQLAGTKKELMPVFSGINQEAVEQRPMLQSLGKQKNTLWLGGLTDLPDDLKIDPREALMSGSNIPADLVETAGELASALETLKYNPGDGLQSGSAYGARLPQSRTLAQTNTSMPNRDFYNFLTTPADEPLLFDMGANTYSQTSMSHSMQYQ